MMYRGLKSPLERCLAAVLILVLAPVLLLCALCVLLDGGGPVLYRQTRVGRHGIPFRILKFRTMCVGADRRVMPSVATSVLFKLRHDPRVTRVGRLLRRYSLDELPQLVNVLLGHMSLVGPRPALSTEVERYPAAMYRRLDVRPGMTGLWQVSGRSDLPWDEAVRLDLHYVEHRSFALDARILLRTPAAVLTRTGAY
jgi:lipopolysaccharide/colanic/teichoic acid biosynthesis glycosyltransferase